MALHPHVDNFLKAKVGSAYSVSGTDATLSGSANLDHATLAQLLDVAFLAKHDVKLVAGALKVVAR